MASETSDLKVVISGDSAGAENAFQSVASVAAGVGLEQIIAGITTKVIDLGQAFIDMGVKSGESLEHIRINLERSLGTEPTDKLLKSLEDLSDATPFTSEQFDGLALKLTNAKVPAENLTAQLKDISNISAGTGSSVAEMGQIFENLGQTISIAHERGVISSLQLRSIAANNIPIYQAVADVLNKNAAAEGHWATATGETGSKHALTAEQVTSLNDKVAVQTERLQKMVDGHKTSQAVIDQHTHALEANRAKLGQVSETHQVWVEAAKVSAEDLLKNNKDIKISAEDLDQALAALSKKDYAQSAEQQSKTLDGVKKNIASSAQEISRSILGISNAGQIQQGGLFDKMKDSANTLFSFLNAHKDELITFGKNAINALMGLSAFVTGTLVPGIMRLKPAFDFVIITVQNYVLPAFTKLGQLWKEHHTTIMQLAALISGILYIALLGLIAVIGLLSQAIIFVLGWIFKLVEAFTIQLPAAIQILKDNVAALGIYFITLGNNIKATMNDIIVNVKRMVNETIDAINHLIAGANSIGGKLGSKINIPTIPHLAQGTDYFQGGMAVVGEQGPELVSLPTGSQVIPAQQTAQLLNQHKGVSVTINNPVVRNDQDINNLTSQIVKILGRSNELARIGLI